MVGVTAQAIANYEAGIREPDLLVCLKLAMIAPTFELRNYYLLRLSGDPNLFMIASRLVLGELASPAAVPVENWAKWTREDLEKDASWKWAWAFQLRGKTNEELKAAAKSMDISLKTLQQWIELAWHGTPESFIPAKKRRSVYASISHAETPEETRLVAQLLAILRSPGAMTKAVKAVIEEVYESLTPGRK